ncbi:MAG: molybdopterin-dependent oxidoreductase [Nitrospirae bacterium]|nr:molybdopterin-dependent oxidoreductase [Nitrospirota bacterium]
MRKEILSIIGSGVSLTRRAFIKVSAAAGAVLLFGVEKAKAAVKWLNPRAVQNAAPTQLDKGSKTVYSVCLACNARCGIRSVVNNGKLVKNSGNPYHPYNERFEPIPYNTPVKDTLKMSSAVCGKSQDGPNYVHNPYRVIKPLKRSGARGSGKFEPIEWEQMIKEVAHGGKLFNHLGEDRVVPGVKDLNSDDPINPSAPELGSVRNGLVFIGGRDQNARKEFSDRFVKLALGSVNRIGHTDICGIGFRQGNMAFTERKAVEVKADPLGAEYILVFGANIYEALQPGVNTYEALVAKRSSEGKLKYTIVDPRATNASTHAEDWIPLKPGQDGAMAMGIIRWIIDNDRHNKEFLSAPSSKAASAIGHACYTNASHLVIVDDKHPNARKFLRMSDLDPSVPKEVGAAYVVLTKDNKVSAFDKVDSAQLDAEAVLKSTAGTEIKVKTSFRLMKEAVMEHNLDDYAKFSGVEKAKIEKVAREFTSYGTKAAVTQYHGAGNYISGTYASYPVAMLNALIGSVDRKGGYMKAGGGAAAWNSGLYDLKTFEGARKLQGPPLSREKFAYEKTTEFKKNGYPSKRPWFPFSHGGLCVETMSGMDQQYPYPCKIFMSYFFNPVYSIPGGYRYIETLKNTEKVPLYISIDIAISETNIYADYIVPDLTYLEGHYGFLTPHAPALKFTGIRTPVMEPLTGKTADGRPFSEETFLIDVAKEAGLPGFGDNAIKGKDGKLHPLNKAEDFYLRAISNVAAGAKLPEASQEEVDFVEQNYPVAKHKDMLTEKEWRQVCYALARGGVFDRRYEDHFDAEKHKFGLGRVAIYNEELGRTKNSITGEYFSGTLKYVPPTTPKGKVMAEVDKDYPFTVITYKMNLHAQARTVLHKWSMEVFPTNYIEMHESDAKNMGLKNMDEVKIVSKSNPKGVKGKVKLTKLIRQGCIGVSNHYGHTQMGASRVAVRNAEKVFLGGKTVADSKGLIPNSRHATGTQFNYVTRLDEDFANTPMVDVVGGIPDFSSTRVKVVKI